MNAVLPDPQVKPDLGAPDDLRARVLSAIVLIPLAVGAALAGGPWIAAAAGAAVVAMAYEWARMSEPKAVMPAFLFALFGALGAVMLTSHERPLGALGLLALAGGLSALRRRGLARMAETWGGVLYIGAPCVAFLWLRGQDMAGLEIALALFVIIWSTDVAAYFAGRLIGGPIIMAALSPNKTYSGLAGGTLAGLLAGLVCARLFEGPYAAWAVAGATLAVLGLAGDLFESMLKRRFGVKDSSRLIPGHGGVLDRIDGLMFASMASALALVLRPDLAGALFGGAS